jgi:hypothetical protein
MKNVWSWRWMLVCAPLVACAVEVDAPGVALDELANQGDGLGVQRAALGAITTLVTTTAPRLLALNGSAAAFSRDPGASCSPTNLLLRYRFSTGSSNSTQGCSGRYTLGATDATTTVVYDSVTRDLLRFDTTVTRIATIPQPVGKIFMDSTNVYWADTLGIYKIPRAGGARTQLKSGQFSLRGLLNNEALFYEKRVGQNEFKLYSITTSGTNPSIWGTFFFSRGFEDFSIGPTSLLWVATFGDGTRQVRTLSRILGGGIGGVVAASTTDTFHHPVESANGTIYFAQKTLQGLGSVKIKRKVSGAEPTEQLTLLTDVVGMFTNGTSLWWVEDTGANRVLKRAPL